MLFDHLQPSPLRAVNFLGAEGKRGLATGHQHPAVHLMAHLPTHLTNCLLKASKSQLSCTLVAFFRVLDSAKSYIKREYFRINKLLI